MPILSQNKILLPLRSILIDKVLKTTDKQGLNGILSKLVP